MSILELLAAFDVTAPLASLFAPQVENITIAASDQWAMEQLKRECVKVRHPFVHFDRLVFDVPASQFDLAVLKLRRMGLDMQPGRGRPWNRRKI